MAHNHEHHNISSKNIGIAVFLNIGITIIQIIGGVISGSVALLTDALHNFSDVISLLLSFFTNRLAKKAKTTKYNYGYKRAEILSTFINSLTLIAIAVFLVIEAVKRILIPELISSEIVIYFAFASIIINILSVVILQKDAKKNINIKSAYLHLLTDVMTSVSVMMGGIIMKYTNLTWIDSALSILIAIYLVFSSYKLLRLSIDILMQSAPSSINIAAIKDQISTISEIEKLKDIRVWKLNEKDYFLEADIYLKNNLQLSETEKIIASVGELLSKHHIQNYRLQPKNRLL